MYEEYFGFGGSPFRLAPDPNFFFGSRSHNKAMAYLHYGLRQAEGFIVITGEIGAGKSVLIGHLIDQLDRSNVLAANLLTPNLAPEDLLSHILSAFRIEPSGSGKTAEIEAFEDFLFDQMNHGRRVLLIVDEAQNLPIKTLEELRVLSNLEYDGTPLFQVFLVGQPDFRDTMARPDMEQLRQRVIASYHLEPMARAETEKYIEHRLTHVGWNGDPKFTAEAFSAIHAASGGVPRKIHKLCNRVLLYCSVEKLRQIDDAVIALVLSDMNAEQNAAAPAARDDAVAEFEAPAAIEVAEPAAEAPAEAHAAPNVEVEVEAEVEVAAAPQPVESAAVEVPVAAPVAAEETQGPQAPAAAAPSAALSVFDRLRAKRKGEAATGTGAPDDADLARRPTTATLDDVANAIAAAGGGTLELAPAPPKNGTAELAIEAEEEAASSADLPEGWKQSVVMSINDTRDELKRAHQSVAKLRRQLGEIDKRRTKRRVQIAASLERAESLLAEFQNAWR